VARQTNHGLEKLLQDQEEKILSRELRGPGLPLYYNRRKGVLMPRLTKIYTRKGDRGKTSLGTRERVPKDSLRVETYGTVDELNSMIGLAISLGVSDPIRETLIQIQDRLLDLGADLAFPVENSGGRSVPRIQENHIKFLEEIIDSMNDELGPLENFVLPGGTTGAGALHVARTICRRAERLTTTLGREETISEFALPYLNRLSDTLFVMARYDNHLSGISDTLWGNPD
jgi:cob(I)alamin adenosyltransferase